MQRAPAVSLLLLVALVSLLGVIAVQKIEKRGSPIGKPTVSKAFSPNGDGVQDTAKLTLSTKRRDQISVWIINAHGTRITQLANDRNVRGMLTLLWNGSGASRRQGSYRMQVHSARAGRTITVPGTIKLDLTPPRVGTPMWDTTRMSLHVIRAKVTLPNPADVASVVVQFDPLTPAGGRTDDVGWTTLPTVRILRAKGPKGSETIQIASKLPSSALTFDMLNLQLAVRDAAGNPTFETTAIERISGNAWQLDSSTVDTKVAAIS